MLSSVSAGSRKKRAMTSTYSRVDDTCSNFDNIKRIIVSAASFGIRVDVGWIFPCLREATVVEIDVTLLELTEGYEYVRSYGCKDPETYLAEDSLLFILLDWVSFLVGGNLILLSVLGRKWTKIQ